MSQRYSSDPRERVAIVFGLVGAALIAIGWWLFSGPSPVEIAKQTADSKTQAKDEALRDLKGRIDAEEQRHRLLGPADQKHSREICAQHNDWGIRVCDAVAQGQIFVGMNADQARMAWGKPRSVEPMSIRRERWLYASGSVDLEDGVVTSFQQSREK